MQVQGADKPYDDINITPMLDLAYVLLVIFIIMTTAAVQGAKVDLPKGSATQSLSAPKTKVIGVSVDGSYTLDAVPMANFAELQSRLAALVATSKDLPIVIKGDTATQFGRVSDVLDLCRHLNISSVGIAQQKVGG